MITVYFEEKNTGPKRFFILTDKGIKRTNGCKLRLVKYKWEIKNIHYL